jgi:hypothetical protein
VQAVPQGQAQREAQAVLLLQEVEKVLRQAVALQQLVALPQVPGVPLLEPEVPVQGQVSQLVLAEAQVEVLEPGAQVLVQAPLPEAE